MSAIDEQIVREFFELNGFLVRQLSKHQVQSRRKRADEAADFAVFNPRPQGGGFTGDFHIFPSNLRTVRRAVVSVIGWHTDRITPAKLRTSPEIFEFLAPEVNRSVLQAFPDTSDALFTEITRILVIPGLADQEDARRETVRILRERGVDGVLLFRSLLVDLSARVEVNNNYRKSDVLQILRLMKNYGLLADTSQTEFNFGRPNR